MESVLEVVSERYGPYAYGMVMLLIMWFIIVKPELAQQRLEFRTQQEIVKQMEVVTESLKTSSQILNSASERLENLYD